MSGRMAFRIRRAASTLWAGTLRRSEEKPSQGSRSRAARWVLRSKPLPLAGRTNRKRRQHRSGPVIYSVFLASERPNPPKLEVREVRARAPPCCRRSLFF